MSNFYPAWTNDGQSTLTPVADTRPVDFGTQLLDQFKQYARITYTNDDNILPGFIDSAIDTIEQYLEFNIFPRSFEWDVGENTGYERYEVPMRNCKVEGAQYDFEPLRGMKIMLAPVEPEVWPTTLVCGFDDATEIPPDLLMAILGLAATFEQTRTTPDIASLVIPKMIITRYGKLRC